MPIHFNELNVASQVAGLKSALIVPCNLCPAVTVAVKEKKPFMRLFKSLIKSAPFEAYIEALQSRLAENGIKATVFRSNLYHQWFLCMWTARRRNRLRNHARSYDAVVVLGCGSAAETVREAVKSYDCKVIEGLEVAGIMNAQLSFQLPCNVSFENCRIVPISAKAQKESLPS